MMPRISGFEVCKRLRADPATRDVAVLMVTALDQPSDMERAVEVGAEDVPVQADQKERAAPARALAAAQPHCTSGSSTAPSPTSRRWNAANKQHPVRLAATRRERLRRALPFGSPLNGQWTHNGSPCRSAAEARPPVLRPAPWVYAGAVAAVEGEPADGDVVDLVSHAGHFVARGLYNSRSKIRVRLYTWDAERPSWTTPSSATGCRPRFACRTALGLDGPGRACRLVFSEGDGLSGVTVDRYDRWLVVQFTGLGLARRRELLTEILVELLRPEGVYLRTERGIGQLEGLELQDGLLWGRPPDGPVVIEETRPALPRQPGRGAEDRLLPRPARQPPAPSPGWPPAGTCWTPSATPAASACTPPAPAPVRSSAWTSRSRPWPWRGERRPERSGSSGIRPRRRVRRAGRAGGAGRAVRPGGAGPAEVRPRPAGRGRGAARLPAACRRWRCGCWSRTAFWRLVVAPASSRRICWRNCWRNWPPRRSATSRSCSAAGRPRTTRLGVVPGIALPEVSRHPGPLKSLERNVCQ